MSSAASPQQAGKEGANGTLTLLAVLSIIGILTAFMLRSFVGSPLGGVSFWIILPLTIMATVVVFLGSFSWS
jgi:hypothetical protein